MVFRLNMKLSRNVNEWIGQLWLLCCGHVELSAAQPASSGWFPSLGHPVQLPCAMLRAIFIFPLFFPIFPQPMDDALDLRLLPMVFYVSMYPLSLLSHALLCHKTPS